MIRRLKLQNANFVQSSALRLMELGHAPDQIFAGFPFDQSILSREEPVTDSQSIVSFFQRAAVLSRDDLFGFRLGRQTDLRQAGILGYLAVCAPRVQEFLSNLSGFASVFNEALFFDVSALTAKGAMTWGWYPEGQISPAQNPANSFVDGAGSAAAATSDLRTCRLGAQYSEFLLGLIVTSLRLCAESPLRLQEVAFCHQRPAGTPEIEEFCGCRVRFSAQRNLLRFDTADLLRELTTADTILLRILKGCAQSQLQGAQAEHADTVAQVERRIAYRLAAGTASLETVSSDLGMSPRTLSRKLSDQGSSYFRILEGLRMEMAKRYLHDRDLVLAEIAHLLGYRGLSSFNDAFKRWTGHSPGKFRSKS